MQRGSDRMSAHRDDEMKHELRDFLRSGHPTRTEEWQDPEPAADDDPAIAGGPVVPNTAPESLETLHLELARFLGRTSFPAGPRALIDVLREKNAPEQLADSLERLPAEEHYANAHELALAVAGSGGS
ncbi:DUF2795 domain-containing protein [Streptomyces sp. NBC_00687]|uniref:DUF2795 domain-containing protein n=1 Tax=Streptomyces sp. NBC_00687 TaxID=2975807 RepID=UPI0022524336|nr:DUF2795 domain-containing protein [Streptomyces sp. NBC_00687]MCX4917960.1 DUF2795 domain-containing protein [Streptomyces sp. NBC_00687]